MARLAEQAVAAAVATAQARAVERFAGELLARAPQQGGDVFGAGGGVAALELDGLARPREGADGDDAGLGVRADEIADEKIAAVKVLEVLVDDQSDEQVAARFALFLFGELVDRLRQDFVSRAVADLVDQISFRLGDGPGVTDGRATLRNDAGEGHLAADGNAHAALLPHLAIEINLGALLLRGIAGGQAARNRQRRVSFVPTVQPGFAIEMKRIGEGEPAVDLLGVDPRFHVPIARTSGLLDLLLREVNRFQRGAWQGVKSQHQARFP